MTVREFDVRGLLFDFGNTLFAHGPLAATIVQCADRIGACISDEDAVALARRIDATAMSSDELAHPRDLDAALWKQRWQILYGIADESCEGLGDAINASMHAPFEWVPYAQTAAVLRSLGARGVAVGIVSNTGWDVRSVFAAHGMIESVASFTLSYEAGAVKPDPRIFDAACVSLRLAPNQVVMVGDDPMADSGAVRAGIRTLLLPGLPPGADNGIADVLKLVGIDD
ncbi:MAG: HAD-IA family hydrolase [Ilumatobacteraceae bacterium]